MQKAFMAMKAKMQTGTRVYNVIKGLIVDRTKETTAVSVPPTTYHQASAHEVPNAFPRPS